MAGRTKKGNVTAAQRQKATGSKTGKYPVYDVKSALSAIKLRHHGKGISAAAVLAKVARSPFARNARVKAALERARAKDKSNVS